MPRHERTLIRPQNSNGGVDGKEVLGVSEREPEEIGDSTCEGDKKEPEDSETRKPQVAKRPHTPTRAELEAHLPLHLEYRSWCPHCRAGRGISMQHRTDDKREAEEMGITVSLDYCFMSADDSEEDMRAILVCYDHSKKGLWAVPVERKGAQEEVVKWVTEKLEESGYAGVAVTLKSDQEPAMLSLKQAIAVRRKAVTPMIESPVRESKSNGRIERAIRKWQAQFRTIRHHVESRIGEKLENASAIIEWMIVWVADIISKYAIQENGRTSYEMTTQHTVKHKIVGFAERVHYKFKIQDSKKDKTSYADSGTGYFGDIVNRNTQYLVARKEGVVTCSTISRMPEEESYSRECIEHIQVKYTDQIFDDTCHCNS